MPSLVATHNNHAQCKTYPNTLGKCKAQVYMSETMPNPVPCYKLVSSSSKNVHLLYTLQAYNICNILLKYIIVSQRTVSVHYILPNLWQKPAAEFPKKIIHLKVWSTIHVLSFNPKFDLNPRLTHIPKQGIVCWELSFSKKKNLQIFVVKQGYTWFMFYLTDLLTPKVLR